MQGRKKGITEMWWILAAAIIAFLVVIFILIWFQGSGGKIFENVDKRVGQLGDKDGDKVVDLFDQCPEIGGAVDKTGCPPELQEQSGAAPPS